MYLFTNWNIHMQIDQSLNHVLVNSFYISHNAWLHKWLSKKLGSSFDAADLTQDTFITLLTKIRHEPISEPRAYLTRIAHDLMVNHLRRRDLERAYNATLCDPYLIEYPSPEIRAIALETLIAIDNMLSALQPKVREAYLLMQLDGLKHKEIAKKLDISVKTVGVYIAKAVLHCLTYELSLEA